MQAELEKRAQRQMEKAKARQDKKREDILARSTPQPPEDPAVVEVRRAEQEAGILLEMQGTADMKLKFMNAMHRRDRGGSN